MDKFFKSPANGGALIFCIIMNQNINKELRENGFVIIQKVFTYDETDNIIKGLSNGIYKQENNLRQPESMFALRRFLINIPEMKGFIFNKRLEEILDILSPQKDYFITKSIYFDKPALSNWFVAYHQDIMITVKDKCDVEGFAPWVKKDNEFNVQPPVSYLENNFTIRIHLDDTDANNGALRVISRSHLHGICKKDFVNHEVETETVCNVNRGGVMIMKPLLFHASSRSVNNKSRRVIHIEYSNCVLPGKLEWAEKSGLPLS